jgi:hypothetical protein
LRELIEAPLSRRRERGLTREQIIVLAFIAGAFLAGWVARALIGWALRRASDLDAAAAGDGRPGRGRPLGHHDERFTRALDESRRDLDRAIQAYHGVVAQALGGRGSAPAAEAVPGGEVSDALRSDAANRAMRAGISRDRGADLTDLELDLTDWGFTYGVAWAAAREREGSASDDVVAHEALGVAETVFRAYTDGADWTECLGDRRNGRAGSK